MSTNIEPKKTLDCIGFYCPEPVFRTRVELDSIKEGEILEVLADDPAAKEDIKSLVKRIGHEILRIEKEGSVYKFLIRKNKMKKGC